MSLKTELTWLPEENERDNELKAAALALYELVSEQVFDSGRYTKLEGRMIWVLFMRRMLDPFQLQCYEDVVVERGTASLDTEGPPEK